MWTIEWIHVGTPRRHVAAYRSERTFKRYWKQHTDSIRYWYDKDIPPTLMIGRNGNTVVCKFDPREDAHEAKE